MIAWNPSNESKGNGANLAHGIRAVKRMTALILLCLVTFVSALPAAAVAPPASDKDYLIVTTTELYFPALYYAMDKEKQGYAVEVLTLDDDDYGTFPSIWASTHEEIFDYLKQRHIEEGFRYVLLLGDTAKVPTRFPKRAAFGWRDAVSWHSVVGLSHLKIDPWDTHWQQALDKDQAHYPSKDFFNRFGTRVSGYLKVNQPGVHSFALRADDYGRLTIDGVPQIEELGHSEPQVKSVWLDKGYHTIEVGYAENDGVAGLKLVWREPGKPFFREISSSQLVSITMTPSFWGWGWDIHWGELTADFYQFPDSVTVSDLSLLDAAIASGTTPSATEQVNSLEFSAVRDMPSDVYYTDLYEDLTPHFAIGRIPAATEQEAIDVLGKWIQPPLMDDGKVQTFGVSDAAFNDWQSDLVGMTPSHFTFDLEGAEATTGDVIEKGFYDAANDIVLYTGHGGQKSWGWDVDAPSGLSILDDDNFALKVTGQFTIPQTGFYEHRLTSDDGAALYIDNALVADNWKGGAHVAVSASTGNLHLTKGAHSFTIYYQELTGGAVLRLERKVDGAWRTMAIGDGPIVSATVSIYKNKVMTVYMSKPYDKIVGFTIKGEPDSTVTLSGGTLELSTDGSLQNADIGELKNTHAPVVLGFACMTAWPEENDNLAHALLMNPDGAASVYVGSTRVNTSGSNEPLSKAFYLGLTDAINSNKEVGLAEVFQSGQLALLADAGYTSRAGAYQYFGDPSYLVKEVHQGTAQGPVALRAASGLFVTAQNGGGDILTPGANWVDVWETFELVEFQDGKIALQADNGLFVSAENGGGDVLTASRPWAHAWERFEIMPLWDNLVILRSNNGQFVSAGGGSTGALTATTSNITWDEVFALVDLEGTPVTIQAHNGQYLSATWGGGGALLANRDQAQEWEIFDLIDVGFEQSVLRTHDGHFISAMNGGGGDVDAAGEKIAAWELFELEALMSYGAFGIKAKDGHYLCAEDGGGGEVVANRDYINVWETFTILSY